MSGIGLPIASSIIGPAGAGRISQPFGYLGVAAEPAGWLEAGPAGNPRRYRAVKSAPEVAGELVTYHADVHPGLDYAISIGTPLLAVEHGRVVAAGTYASTGEHYLMLRFHRDATWQTLAFYTHLSRILIPVGAMVARGQHICDSGNSGMSTGPHLHFEIRRGAASVDPHLSGSSAWGRWSPRRLYVGGDMAGVPWISPAGAV